MGQEFIVIIIQVLKNILMEIRRISKIKRKKGKNNELKSNVILLLSVF